MLLKNLKKVDTIDELYTLYVKLFLLINDIKLQPKVEVILRYFLQYGFVPGTYEKILADKVVPMMQSISNAKTILFEEGLLTKKPKWGLRGGLENTKLEDLLDVSLRIKLVKDGSGS